MIRFLNTLESFFQDNNIRFAVGLEIPDQTLTRVRQVLTSLVNSHPLFDLTIEKVASQHILKQRTERPKVHSISLEHGRKDVATLEKLTKSCIGQSFDDVALTICSKPHQHLTSSVMVVLDFAHAFIDAKAAADVIKSFKLALGNDKDLGEQNLQNISYGTNDWAVAVGQQLSEHIAKQLSMAETTSESTTKRKHGHVVSAHQILGSADESGDILYSIEARKLQTILQVLRSHKYNAKEPVNEDSNPMTAPSMTGLWAYLLHAALSQMYFNDSSTCTRTEGSQVAVSVLVDLRPFLDGANKQRQAIGTVCLSTTNPGRDSHCDGAARMTQELQSRLKRGEMFESALAMCTGDEKSMEAFAATVELSNHGVYDVTDGTKVVVAQRFDDYKGVSVVVWTEGYGETGEMRAMVSYAGVERRRVEGMMGIVIDGLKSVESIS